MVTGPDGPTKPIDSDRYDLISPEEVTAGHHIQYEPDKFIVLKTDEVLELLDPAELEQLHALLTALNNRREGEPHSYYVVNQGEPYAGQILHEILINEERKEWMYRQGLWPKPKRRKTD